MDEKQTSRFRLDRPSKNVGLTTGLARFRSQSVGRQMAFDPFSTEDSVGLTTGLARFSLHDVGFQMARMAFDPCFTEDSVGLASGRARRGARDLKLQARSPRRLIHLRSDVRRNAVGAAKAERWSQNGNAKQCVLQAASRFAPPIRSRGTTSKIKRNSLPG